MEFLLSILLRTFLCQTESFQSNIYPFSKDSAYEKVKVNGEHKEI